MCIAHAPAEKGIRERGSGIWWKANETDQGLSQKVLTYMYNVWSWNICIFGGGLFAGRAMLMVYFSLPKNI